MFKPTPKKITSPQNRIVKHLAKLRQSRRYREQSQSILVTGHKVIRELSLHHKPKKILTTELTDEIPACEELYEIHPQVLKKITLLPSPEGILAEFPLPPPSSLENKKWIIAFDQINDPGNLGTLLRTALAFGWEGVYLLPGCVDPFNEKAFRASRGALFRLPYQWGSWEELTQLAKTRSTFVADTEGHPLDSCHVKERALLILSNEAQGVSEKGDAFGEKVAIPMSGKMESLNVAVAGGIIMYTLRQRG